VAVIISSSWAFAFTYGMLKIIDVCTPVRVDMATEEIGLDEPLHGEHAYEELGDKDVIHHLAQASR